MEKLTKLDEFKGKFISLENEQMHNIGQTVYGGASTYEYRNTCENMNDGDTDRRAKQDNDRFCIGECTWTQWMRCAVPCGPYI